MRTPRSIRAALAALASVAALAACTTVDSGPVATSDVQPRIRVVVDAGGTAHVSVALLTGFASALELQSGESLTARLEAGPPVALSFGTGEVFGASAAYFATLDGATVGDEIVLSWTRPDGVDAPATTVVVPEPLSDVATAGAAFGFDDDVGVSWAPDASGDEVDARLRLEACDDLDADELEAARFLGGFPTTFPIEDGAGTFEPILLVGASTTCSAVLEIGRSSDAIDLDPAFAGLRARSSVVQLATAVALVFAEP